MHANSDKRYETARKSISGEWAHDDLRPWIDTAGDLQPSKLFAALILKKTPGPATDEFGVPLGKKYSTVTVAQLATANSGAGFSDVNLLPDLYLRPKYGQLSLAQFKAEASNLVKQAAGQNGSTQIPVRERVRELLATRIDFTSPTASSLPPLIVDKIFTLHKGTPGLTEAVIYNQFDPGGLRVYGGGEATPRFSVKAKSLNKSGTALKAIKGPALVVSMDGSSGAVRVVDGDTFFLNHHGCALKLRDGFKIDLHYAAQQLEGGLRALASNKSASATLTLPRLRNCTFQKAKSTTDETTVAELRKALEMIRDRFS